VEEVLALTVGRRRSCRISTKLSISALPVRLLIDSPNEEAFREVHAAHPPGHHADAARPDAWATLSQEEQQAIAAAYQEINRTPGVTPGNGLGPPETATTVRVKDGKTMTTDGPFVETKAALNGYLTYEAQDLDAAIELAAKIPAARLRGAIEVRPIMEW